MADLNKRPNYTVVGCRVDLDGGGDVRSKGIYFHTTLNPGVTLFSELLLTEGVFDSECFDCLHKSET